jgi:hypothetical protein
MGASGGLGPPRKNHRADEEGRAADGRAASLQAQAGAESAGEQVIEKRAVQSGPKAGKKGYVDDQGRIWVKDRAHAGLPDHWDVQSDGGDNYIRVDLNGELCFAS